jgi:[acyl-carrier-protein] S-malonyltransferase
LIAFIFPGQGAQKVGMGKALAEAFPVCRDTFAEADAALGEAISRLCFEGPESELALTENTQPAILAVSTAAHRVLASSGIRPSFVAGHSLGEYSANVAAGTMSFADGLQVVRRRGRYMQEAVPVGMGAMAAILGLDAEQVQRACEEAAEGDVVAPANLNGPGQIVIAGSRDAVARASARARALGARRVMSLSVSARHAAAVARAGELLSAAGAKRVLPLPVSAPFHCALMQPAAERLAPELRALRVADPRVPVVANVDADLRRTSEGAIDALVAQVSSPVRWEEVVRRLASEGVTTYVEVGPGTVLSGLVRKIDRDATVLHVGEPADFESVTSVLRV